jgi:hypothetical protein
MAATRKYYREETMKPSLSRDVVTGIKIPVEYELAAWAAQTSLLAEGKASAEKGLGHEDSGIGSR